MTGQSLSIERGAVAIYWTTIALLAIEAIKSTGWVYADLTIRLFPGARDWFQPDTVSFVLGATPVQEAIFFLGVAFNYTTLALVAMRRAMALVTYALCAVMFNIDWVISSVNGVHSQTEPGYFNLVYQAVVLLFLYLCLRLRQLR